MAFDIQQTDVKKIEEIEEATGKLNSQNEENKLMRSVLEGDKDKIDQGKLICDAINQGLSSFTPNMMYEQFVKNYSIAQQLYGPTLIKLLCGYNANYVKKNIQIPEFQREIKEQISRNIESLKDEDLIDKEGIFTEKGIELASLVTYFEELDKLVPKGVIGEKIHKKLMPYGIKDEVRDFKNGDRYKDIAIKRSVKLAVRRGHKKLDKKDLRVFERKSKGRINVIYALDASGSMKGKKISACKRAGIALAFRAIEEKDKVGLIAFGDEVKEVVHPTTDFKLLLHRMTSLKASRQTDIVGTIRKAIEVFPTGNFTNHLILITDALPNIGDDPEQETLKEVSLAFDKDITVSLIGIKLDSDGEKLAKRIVELGGGRLYGIKNVNDVDRVVLEEYYSLV